VSEPVHSVKGIDHLIVTVRDLDRSERIWRALGFHTTPRGFHKTGGTANHLIMLDRTYIELLGLADPSADSPYRRTVEESPGLAGIALRGSADETYRYWLAKGFEPSPPESLARGVEIGGRAEVARFALTRLPSSAELPFLLFCCDQLTPQFVWQAHAPPHPNSAQRLEEVVIAADGTQTRAHFERMTGRTISNSASGSSLALGECRITFLSATEFVRRFGSDAAFRTARLPTLAALTLASSDVSRARQFAEEAGWRVRSTNSGGFTVAIPSEGVVIEWTPAT
jgi:catechol 2,3-dioxygenase-like lactoylglutathione lyase family enzyme